MSFPIRTGLAAAACLLLLGLMVWGFASLPAFGHYPGPYGNLIDEQAPHERKIPNAISAVNFDYRGVDTLGEEYILFAAVAGITMILRHDRARTTSRALPAARGRERGNARTEAIQLFSIAGAGLTIAFGIYLGIHPHLTPGGGFQGFAMLAGFAALTFVGLGYDTFVRIARQEPHEALEAVGAGTYALIGLATLAASGYFLANVLPLGEEGQLFSGGTIPVINFFVALEVFAGFVLMFLEFARETRVEVPKEQEG
jgi:multicomponent Na+:H+ antiporter subunit B